MNDLTPRKLGGSLIERAAKVYDFNAELRARNALPPTVTGDAGPAPAPLKVAEPPREEVAVASSPAMPPRATGAVARIDREVLVANGLLVPDAPVGALAEEFRLVKRQLMVTARSLRRTDADRSRTILVCSAKPNDGKTYCAVNLAISMAAEREVEVILIDADFAKPDVMSRLGLAEGKGLLDALADAAHELGVQVRRSHGRPLAVGSRHDARGSRRSWARCRAPRRSRRCRGPRGTSGR